MTYRIHFQPNGGGNAIQVTIDGILLTDGDAMRKMLQILNDNEMLHASIEIACQDIDASPAKPKKDPHEGMRKCYACGGAGRVQSGGGSCEPSFEDCSVCMGHCWIPEAQM